MMFIAPAIGIIGLAIIPVTAAASPLPPEKQVILESRYLKPIIDSEWQNIAGKRVSENYDIVRGDTLYDISKRFFADPKYWPKIWALNNHSITNPHIIRPGNRIVFSPGNGSALPSVDLKGSELVASSDAKAPVTRVHAARRSDEWKYLPKQRWEEVYVEIPAEVDPDGFDRRSKITFRATNGFELKSIAASERIAFVGEIMAANQAAHYLSNEDIVFIRSHNEDLQVGQTYAVTREPEILKSPESERTGYAYQITGKVKITGLRDGLFIGTVIDSGHLIERGASLIALPPRFQEIEPIPGPAPVEGVLFIDPYYAGRAVSQQHQVFIDRGSEDGITPGMIFGVFLHDDPVGNGKITESDFVPEAHLLVMQTTQRFSAALVMSADSVLAADTRVVLLTDLANLKKHKILREKSLDDAGAEMGPMDGKDNELEKLDQLDQGNGIGKGEAKDLDQLEQWNGEKSAEPGLDSELDNAPIEIAPNDATPIPPTEPEASLPAAEPESLLPADDSGLDALPPETAPPQPLTPSGDTSSTPTPAGEAAMEEELPPPPPPSE